jgi:hypothetical protein
LGTLSRRPDASICQAGTIKPHGVTITPAATTCEAEMKTTTIALLLLVTAAMPAQAASNWCANYGRDGRENCHFNTLQQCLAFVQGLTGTCRPSQYRGLSRRMHPQTYGADWNRGADWYR